MEISYEYGMWTDCLIFFILPFNRDEYLVP